MPAAAAPAAAAAEMTAASAKMAAPAAEPHPAEITRPLEILRPDRPPCIHLALLLQSSVGRGIHRRPAPVDPLLPLSLFPTPVDISLPVRKDIISALRTKAIVPAKAIISDTAGIAPRPWYDALPAPVDIVIRAHVHMGAPVNGRTTAVISAAAAGTETPAMPVAIGGTVTACATPPAPAIPSAPAQTEAKT